MLAFVTHLPKELVPLAKLSPDDPPARMKPLRRGEGPTTVEVFECCINGQEIAPGYTEQNDPIARRTTLEHQAGGDLSVRSAPVLGRSNAEWLAAVEFFERATNIPAAAPGTGALRLPAGGIGIGIDRLCPALRDSSARKASVM